MNSNLKTDLSFAAFKLTTCDERYKAASKELREAIALAFKTIERLKSADLDYATRKDIETLSDRAHRAGLFLK